MIAQPTIGPLAFIAGPGDVRHTNVPLTWLTATTRRLVADFLWHQLVINSRKRHD